MLSPERKGLIKLATTEIMGSTQSLGLHADCCPTNKERCGIESILFHGYFESSMQFLQSLGFNLKDEVLQEISTLLEANGT
jgi:hypothetical protein